MGVLLWLLFSMCSISQYAIWGLGTGKLRSRDDLLLSSQQRRQMFATLAASETLDSEKLDSELKCGVRFLDHEDQEDNWHPGIFSRIIGGQMSVPGGQPWQVSIKLGRSHFCGGSLVRDNVVVTAAHCVADFDLKLVKNLIVTVGEYDLRSLDEEEQNIPVSKIIVHPAFNRFGYMDSDIALLYLKDRVKYGAEVQPICLPHNEDLFEAGTLCIVSGWGKVMEDSARSDVLQEVELPIIDSKTCSEVLKTLNLPPVQSNMLCAGFPDGGRDACQGDSGGPLACQRASGIWTLVGITSWGIGCGKGWQTDKRRNIKRGSPGVFSKVDKLLDFIVQNIITEPKANYLSPPSPENCNPRGVSVFGESGHIRHPQLTKDSYSDNSLCIWNITVPEDSIILVQFIRIDVEDQVECDHDFVTFCSSKKELIGKICGSMLPSPLLIASNQAIVTFVSDSSNTGGGFEFTFTAVPKASEAGSGCGSVAVLTEEGKFDTANYPSLYPSSTRCHWLIEAPREHVIKLEFEDFAIEISQDCIYDSVAIYDDTEAEHQIALLCGFSVPSPVWSTGSIMLIHFESDEENNFKGFKAKFNFSPSESPKTEFAGHIILQTSDPKAIPLDVCGSPPFAPHWLSTHIVGGEEACPHCWPWHVGLHFLSDYQCGGVVISSMWVLTAAHCVQISKDVSHWIVVAGDHDRTLKEPTEQVRRVKTIIMHQDFNGTSYDSDIALVQVQAPFSYNAVVRPVCLPNSTEPLSSSMLCTVTGWGSIQEVGGLASRLQQARVPILNNDICEQSYYVNHPGGVTTRMLCAGFASFGGQDTCQGDAGGPLVCQNEEEPFILHGIVSWGVGCPKPKRPGVYARVSFFLEWIMTRMKERESVEILINNTGYETSVQLPEAPMNLRAVDGQGCPPEMVLEKPKGYISSLCCPLAYAGDVQCLWMLRISPGGMAKVTLSHLSVLKSDNCQMEFLAIYEESQRGRKILAKLCGILESPVTFLSPGPVVKVEFHSTLHGSFSLAYLVVRHQGPKISYNMTYDVNQQLIRCRDVILTAQEGIICSPGFPDRYSHTTSCHWRIVAPLNAIVQLDFLDFVIEKSHSKCHGGLTIYEGVGSAKEVLGNFCNESPHYPLKSRGPVVTLIFSSGVDTNMKGFVLAYGTHEIQLSPIQDRIRDAGKGCPVLDLIPLGVAEIVSPNYPNIYPDLAICTWTVYSASGNKLKSVIRNLAMEDSRDCIWDSLSIYDGPDQHSELLGRFCGRKGDVRLCSSGSYLTVCFKTDGSVGARGFKIFFEEVNQGPAQGSKNRIELKNQCVPGKPIASEERRCGIPLEDTSPVEEVPTNTSLGEEGKDRVADGSLETPASWPWLVSLQFEKRHFCGGILIDESWVLTAGHCNVSAETDKAVLGVTYLLPGAKHGIQSTVKAVHVHANFSGFPSNNDLILLELENPIQTGDIIAVICLPDQDEKIGMDATCLTAGWDVTVVGKDEFSIRLQQTEMLLLTHEACARYWGEDIKNTNLCGVVSGSMSCVGDSGAPLICKNDGHYKVVGVVSWESDNCDPDVPTVYTWVSAYSRWISLVTNGKL